jgi:hypothetical protein
MVVFVGRYRTVGGNQNICGDGIDSSDQKQRSSRFGGANFGVRNQEAVGALDEDRWKLQLNNTAEVGCRTVAIERRLNLKFQKTHGSLLMNITFSISADASKLDFRAHQFLLHGKAPTAAVAVVTEMFCCPAGQYNGLCQGP